MKMTHHDEARYWWQVTPALPSGPDSQDYHALRRLWGDHTMNTEAKGRGYYRFGSEDNLTPGLFQIWAIFEDPEAMRPLLQAAGVGLRGDLRFLRWAYACEEEVPPGRYPGVTGKFVIPDIVLHYEDAAGAGILAFEVKRPGVTPDAKDAAKLMAYAELPSMRGIARRHAAFLVGADRAEATRALGCSAQVLSWEQIAQFQLAAAEGIGLQAARIAAWIARAYARYGIGAGDGFGAAPPPMAGDRHASAASRAAISDSVTDLRQRNFLLGSETVEAFLAGEPTEPPLDWLMAAKSRPELSSLKLQQTQDRRLLRWSKGWSATQERRVP